MSDVPERARQILDALVSGGIRGMVVCTDAPELPWVVMMIPFLPELSAYTLDAQREGPLAAAVKLFHRSVKGLPEGVTPEVLMATKPFVILRVVQLMLGELGLATKAEKKSP